MHCRADFHGPDFNLCTAFIYSSSNCCVSFLWHFRGTNTFDLWIRVKSAENLISFRFILKLLTCWPPRATATEGISIFQFPYIEKVWTLMWDGILGDSKLILLQWKHLYVQVTWHFAAVLYQRHKNITSVLHKSSMETRLLSPFSLSAVRMFFKQISGFHGRPPLSPPTAAHLIIENHSP